MGIKKYYTAGDICRSRAYSCLVVVQAPYTSTYDACWATVISSIQTERRRLIAGYSYVWTASDLYLVVRRRDVRRFISMETINEPN